MRYIEKTMPMQKMFIGAKKVLSHSVGLLQSHARADEKLTTEELLDQLQQIARVGKSLQKDFDLGQVLPIDSLLLTLRPFCTHPTPAVRFAALRASGTL